jgi:ubiquinone/menaquinone biosynthesis C-methylase UbiE
MTNVIECTTALAATPDLRAIKARQQATWSSGNYGLIGGTISIVGEELAEAMDLRAGMKVLDVAAGNGNATLACARRWCEVVSTDYVDALLAQGRARAQTEGLAIEFRAADAEQLPFADASFDAAVSTFGVMFTPDQTRAAGELLRVTRPGGRIGLANWTPEGFIGQLFKTIGAHLPPPAGVKSPALWGTRPWLEQNFGAGVSTLRAEPRHYVFRYRSGEHFIEVFRGFYGPVLKAFETLDEKGKKTLARDILAVIARFNRSGDATMVVPGEYLEVVMTRR